MATIRYETRILSHVVSISLAPLGRYEISVTGPEASQKHEKSFWLLREAQTEAHAFAHSVLNTPCSCGEISWNVVKEPAAA